MLTNEEMEELCWYSRSWKRLQDNAVRQLPELLFALKEADMETTDVLDGNRAPKGWMFIDESKLMALERIMFAIQLLGDS